MRKEQKEQVDGFVQLLEEAHEEIVKSIVNSQFEEALDILEQCHEGAIQLGTLIEKAEGEGFVTVGFLEEYCEVIYNIHAQIAAGQEVNISGVKKVLKKNYLRIENSVNNDIKVLKEVVFFPYKACMWDCFESLWKKAKEDPECDVYVVPVPYYLKNPDMSLGDMVYEGNDYPEYVPVMDYKTYDVEKRKPDVIFIHNPYDGLNRVTNVHQDYYVKRLCELTDMLVYVPYFVTEYGVPQALRVLPGTVYAHRVIVSSEKEKADYIVGIEKWFAETNQTNEYEMYQPYWRDKFKVLGSPKYNKVLDTERDVNKLPDNWRNKIYKSDGTRKKVLFYNTSLATLIAKDNVLEKMKRTFDIMKTEEDVVLWWRPHPLYEATIKSMKPYMEQEYKSIVEEYIKSDIGIYDDTPDLNRAIAESDAYYGDGSSVVCLFEKVGKPVMRQITEIGEGTSDSGRSTLVFEAVAINGEAYASDYHGNGLYKVDIQTGESKFLRRFDEEPINYSRLHCAAVWIDSKIYFIPGSANKISVYCPENNTIECIEIPSVDSSKYSFYKPEYKFIRAIQNGDDLWLIPSSYPGIIKLNIRNQSIKMYADWIEEDEYFFRRGIALEDKKIICANGKSNAVLIFDMKSETARIEHIGTENNGVAAMCKVNDEYWFAPRLPGAVVAWNPDKNIVREYNKFPKEFEMGSVAFVDVYNFFNKIVFVPSKSNCGLVYENGEFITIRFDAGDGYLVMEYLFETGQDRYFREVNYQGESRFFKVSKESGVITESGFYCEDNSGMVKCMKSAIVDYKKTIKETVYFGLEEFIDKVFREVI